MLTDDNEREWTTTNVNGLQRMRTDHNECEPTTTNADSPHMSKTQHDGNKEEDPPQTKMNSGGIPSWRRCVLYLRLPAHLSTEHCERARRPGYISTALSSIGRAGFQFPVYSQYIYPVHVWFMSDISLTAAAQPNFCVTLVPLSLTKASNSNANPDYTILFSDFSRP